MQYALALVVVSLSASVVQAAPEYKSDPFNDADFAESPLILDVVNPTRGRGELSLVYSQSVIDKYTAHKGLHLQFEYAVLDTLGVALSFGYMHGQLTSIVTDEGGIIGNKVTKYMNDKTAATQNVNPNVPDYMQITGVADFLAIWRPLYGKVNVVSELDVNMQLYLMGGVGMNGRRAVTATVADNPQSPSDYTLAGGGLGEGGLFGDPKVHATLGAGIEVFVLDWLTVHGEARGYLWPETFKFVYGEQSYLAQYWFVQAGVGFIVF